MIRVLGPFSVQDDDLSNYNGGAVERSRKILTRSLTRPSPIGLVSSSSSDITQVYSIEGLSPQHRLVAEQLVLVGTTETRTTQDFIKIHRIKKLSGSPLVGTVTILNDIVTIGTLDPAGGTVIETQEVRCLLAKATAHPLKDKIFHEKFFITNDGLDPIVVTLAERFNSDQAVTFSIDSDANLASQSVNRTVRSPVMPLNSFDRKPKTFLLESGDAWGVWLMVDTKKGTLLQSRRYGMTLAVGADTFDLDLVIPNAPSDLLAMTISNHSNFPVGGGLPHQWVELMGGRMVQEMFYEPDPVTYRDDYYYNTRLNRLYRKLKTTGRPVWKVWR